VLVCRLIGVPAGYVLTFKSDLDPPLSGLWWGMFIGGLYAAASCCERTVQLNMYVPYARRPDDSGEHLLRCTRKNGLAGRRRPSAGAAAGPRQH
jgi:hypothetical protein